jgi:hypothetical protein
MTDAEREAIRAAAREAAAAAPPLSEAQRERLRALLRPTPPVPAPRAA